MNLTLRFEGSSQTALSIDDMFDDLEIQPESRSSAGSDALTGGEVLLVYGLILGAAKTIQLLDDLVYKVRQRHRPFIVVDVTGDDPQVTVVEGVPGMDGEVLIKTNDGQEAKLEHGVSDGEVLTAIKDAISGYSDS